MCIKWFKSKTQVTPIPEPIPVPIPTPDPVPTPVTIVLPHYPPEPEDTSLTMDTPNLTNLLYQARGYWFTQWNVKDPNYFDKVIYEPSLAPMDSNGNPYPAWTRYELMPDMVTESILIQVRPSWCKSYGVLAHESAHVIWNEELTETQRQEFGVLHDSLKDTDSLIKYLYSQNNYGLSSPIEGHAELYRYLGGLMPDTLKVYYPHLL